MGESTKDTGVGKARKCVWACRRMGVSAYGRVGVWACRRVSGPESPTSVGRVLPDRRIDSVTESC
jgi:hypothetical protein